MADRRSWVQSGLSPRLVKEVRAVILDLRVKFSAAVLLVEQNAGLALVVAERGYLLQHGKIVASGAIADLRDNSLMHELLFGPWEIRGQEVNRQ